jgi:hypothetical protein
MAALHIQLTAEARTLALSTLQAADPIGAYTDAESVRQNRKPCDLPNAIRACACLFGDGNGHAALALLKVQKWAAWEATADAIAHGERLAAAVRP